MSFVSKVPEFKARNDAALDLAMARYAAAIDTTIKVSGKTPLKTGMMKGSVYFKKVGIQHYQVIAPKEYSAVQEAGKRGSVVFEHYTTPGTGPKWFESAIKVNEDHREGIWVTSLRGVGIDVKSA